MKIITEYSTGPNYKSGGGVRIGAELKSIQVQPVNWSHEYMMLVNRAEPMFGARRQRGKDPWIDMNLEWVSSADDLAEQIAADGRFDVPRKLIDMMWDIRCRGYIESESYPEESVMT